MKSKRLIPNGGNDRIMTPERLTKKIINKYAILGKTYLEPCKGTGNFVKSLNEFGVCPDWCEINEGRDFFDYSDHVDWIITNPPYSILTMFLKHSLEVADNVVFLCLSNALMFTSRMRLIKDMGFAFKEFHFVPSPNKYDGWPTFGIPFAAVHLLKGYEGDVKFSYDTDFKL